MEASTVRPLTSDDYGPVVSVVDEWWGGRPIRGLLPRLFFEHFGPTSFFVGARHDPEAFLVGLRSQSVPSLGYVHFVGVKPELRGRGLGRMLYLRFFETVAGLGCTSVECITSPVNTGSVAFHQRMGFTLLQSDLTVNGFPVVPHHGGEGQHRVVFRKSLTT
jgi:GNAT superfamily N-acetyltransferase